MIKLLYTTFPDKEEAISAAHTLLDEKLIACANIFDGATSIYRWQGETQQQPEVILFAKTSQEKTQSAIARIKELNSYEMACIVVLPIEGGLKEFTDWVSLEVS